MTEVLEKDIAFQAHLRQIPIKFAWNRRAKLKKTMKKRVVRSDLQKRFNSKGYQTNLKDLNGELLPDLAKVKFKPLTHGGARKGAGRKSLGREPVLLRLSPKLIASLRREAERNHTTLSNVAEKRLTSV